MTQTPAGWYPDPEQPNQQRYYDGTQWTDNRAPVAPTVPAAFTQPKKRGCLTWLLVGGALLIVLIIIAAVASGGGDPSPSSSTEPKSVNAGDKDAADQVKITSCAVLPGLGLFEVKGTASNTTSKRSDFIIEIAITSKNGATQLGTATAIAENVEPGQVARWDAPSAVDFVPGAVCKVSTVTRTASL